MDGVSLANSVPVTWTAAGVLLALIGALFRAWIKADGRANTADVRTEQVRTQLQAAHAKEVERLEAANDKEIAELHLAVKKLRVDFDELNARFERERELRRTVEDERDAAIRRAGGTHAE